MKRVALALIALFTMPAQALAQPAAGGDVIFDSRLRYETVQQDGLTDAEALTLRVRFGWESPIYSGFRVLAEAEAVGAPLNDYNDTIHGPPGQAAIADPETLELNRLQVTWTGVPDTEVVVGRQRIILGNARFVGNVGFRQNEQTFDALKVTTTAFEPVTLTYAYIDRVHRVFGDESPVGEWRSDSHLVHAETPTPIGRLSLYGYWLDFENAPAQSSATLGARLAGSQALTPQWTVNWAVEYARQTDHGGNPGRFDLDYGLLSAGLSYGSLTATVARERLDGDGIRAFQTPLATLHAFQGWADAFLTTPATGLVDDSATVNYAWSTPPIGRNAAFTASWRSFSGANGGLDLGSEFDASARLTLNDRWALEVKTAHFDGAGAIADRSKTWAALEYRF